MLSPPLQLRLIGSEQTRYALQREIQRDARLNLSLRLAFLCGVGEESEVDAGTDVLIVDAVALSKDGCLAEIEALRREYSEMPLVVWLASRESEARRMALLFGADECFTPDDLRPLDAVLRDAMTRAEARSRSRSSAYGDRPPMPPRDRSGYEAFFTLAPFGAGIVDGSGHHALTNAAYRQFLGYSAEEMRGLSVAAVTHPDDLERDTALFLEILAGKRDSYQLEKRYIRKDGRTVWGNFSLFVERNADGSPRLGFGLVEDITERKETEEALRQSQQQLMQAQKMEAVGRLTGGVAHDFNNLIMAIRGNVELLLKEGNWDPAARSDLLEIDGAARRGAQLTQQLLAFSRQQVLSPQVLDLNTRISDMHAILSRLVGESVELVLRLDPAIGSVEADPGQIDQIILNLVVNGRDAMRESGAIVVETGDVEITEAEAETYPYPVRSGPYVQLSVRDSGCGMDEDTMHRIFEPFFTTKGQRGTGLGLSTVYGIVKQSGGYIWVESEQRKGTIFRIYLPRIQVPVGSENCASAPADSHVGSETVLLVEDEMMIRKLTRRMLQGSGYTVLEAASPDAALALCESHPGPIHLIVTDFLMPEMNGRELADRLSTIRPGVPLLYLSGYASDTALQLGMLEPGTAFLQKPVDSQRLTSTVRNLLTEFPISPSDQVLTAPSPASGGSADGPICTASLKSD